MLILERLPPSSVLQSSTTTTCQSVAQPGDALTCLTADLLDHQSDSYVTSVVDIKSFNSAAPAARALALPHDTVKTEQQRHSMFTSLPDSAEIKYTDNNQNGGGTLMMSAAGPVSAGLPWLSHGTKPVAVVIGQHVTGSGGIKQRSLCSRCGKQFASSLAFERHLAVHSLTRPYRCHTADKRRHGNAHLLLAYHVPLPHLRRRL